MKNQSKNLLATTALIAALAFPSGLYAADTDGYTPPEIMRSGDISYVTGGIGDEELAWMKAVRSDYNLRITSSRGAAGAFPGDVTIVISDRAGNTLLNADSGPIFYANLPAGRYTLDAYSGSQDKRQAFTISGNAPRTITLHWRGE